MNREVELGPIFEEEVFGWVFHRERISEEVGQKIKYLILEKECGFYNVGICCRKKK